MIVILGAGLAGIAASWHIGHEHCLILEKKATLGGHASSINQNGYTLDNGPHVSFTKNDYVRDLFAKNAENEFVELKTRAASFYKGNLIEHPAQVHLWQLPSDIRNACYDEMSEIAVSPRLIGEAENPINYGQWLEKTYGSTFANEFPAAYTRKYWTIEPAMLTTDWVGPRMHKPTLDEINHSMTPGNISSAHYISTARYPKKGGYQSFFKKMASGGNLHLNSEVTKIDLPSQTLAISDGSQVQFDQLISTLPLPEFVKRCENVPLDVKNAAEQLDCSQLLLVDVFAPKANFHPHKWFYVYDEDKFATRIHCIEDLAPANAPTGMSGISTEVYFSRFRKPDRTFNEIAHEVTKEIAQLGFITEDDLQRGNATTSWRWCEHANIMFTRERRAALDTIWKWLEKHGLRREPDDLEPTTDWRTDPKYQAGRLVMAGRFAQWKYFWTDDCVLRGKQLCCN